MRFTITTLGCKVNQHDAAALAAELRRLGLSDADPAGPVDLAVVNTCCVTAVAMRKSRQALRRAVRQSPQAAVLVVGCYSDYDPHAIARILASLNVPPARAFIAGHHDDLADCLRQVARSLAGTGGAAPDASHQDRPQPSGCLRQVGRNLGRKDAMRIDCLACRTNAAPDPTSMKSRRLAAVKGNVAGTRSLGPLDRFDGRQRAFVKVQDGCDAFCSYCVVPFTRCNVWSRTARQVLAQCRALLAAGHKEIVLAGVFLGAFGRPTAIRRKWNGQASTLPRLVRSVGRLPGLWRLRLSSLEPLDLTDELIAACRPLPTFAPHFHLPLQSGSAAVLRRMNRQYTADQYRQAVDRARRAFDRPALTTDVIVGFPGESDEDFAATLELARYAGFAKIHAFPFSPIPGTAAWAWRGQAPPPAVVKRRLAALAELESQMAEAYRRPFLGRTLEGLVESPKSPGARFLRAVTDRYQSVRFPCPADASPHDLAGRVARLRIDDLTPAGLSATLLGVLA